MATEQIRKQDLLDNPDPRVPVCFCLDTSGSMQAVESGTGRPTGEFVTIDGRKYRVVDSGTTRLETLQKGLEEFYDAVYKDEDARFAAEICVVTFDDGARVLTDFSRVEYNNVREVVPQLRTGSMTSLGAGVNLALEMLESRKKMYRSSGVDYYQPWLILMTDGEDNPASGDPSELETARRQVRELAESNRLCVYPFFIGDDKCAENSMETLRSLSPRQEPIQVQYMGQMKKLFQWISKSVARISSGDLNADQTIPLSKMDISSWDSKLE